MFAPLSIAPAADFKREVIYQIITDRFFDGSSSNNNPSQSSGLYDSTKTNWRAYWGGDLAGIQQKMSYLAGMGVTAIWISPPVDNLNTNIPDGGGNPTASYHGYQARDFKRIEEHFGNSSNTWTEFDNLVTAAHQNGIKVIVDFAPNHSTQNNAGEFGVALRQRHVSRQLHQRHQRLLPSQCKHLRRRLGRSLPDSVLHPLRSR